MSAPGDFDTRGPTVLAVTVATIVLASVFVIARLISRFCIVKRHSWDDNWMIVAWVLAIGLSFSIAYGTSKGLGRHTTDIPPEWMLPLKRSEYAFSVLYNPALMASKSSILIFYLRLSRNTKKVLRLASYVTLVIVNVSGIVLTFLNIFQCRPVYLAWNASPMDNRCFSIVTIFLCSAPVNIVTDLAILVLPIPVLTGMRLPRKQKTILTATFGLGIFVTIVDVVRIFYLQKASLDVRNQEIVSSNGGKGEDYPWNASFALMWSAVEVNVGIICACIPTMKPLILRILPVMLKDHSGDPSDMTSSQHSNRPDMRKRPSQRQESIAVAREGSVGLDLPPPVAIRNEFQDEIDRMGFLTTPDMNPEMIMTPTPSSRTTEHETYFGFFEMKKPKSMLKTKGADSFKYCLAVTILFFLWGFSYGLLNNLNSAISMLAGYSTIQTVGLATIYFGAYLVGALGVGQWTLRCGGFKATFMTGLCIYGVGAIMFWPSAVLTSYPGFMISTFVAGFGLSVLETAANPFIALCGPARYAEFRLLLAQGVQGIATNVSQILAQKALFAGTLSLLDVQWTYLAVALFAVVLLLFFYYMPLPEAADVDLQIQADELGIPKYHCQMSWMPVIYVTLGLGIMAQFLYVGLQQCNSIWFKKLIEEVQGDSPLVMSPDNYVLMAQSIFTISRFLAAFLCLIIEPRILLLIIFVGGLAFSILTFTWHTNSNNMAMSVIFDFISESPVWPLIFAITLRGMGKKTKSAAAYLTASASGGAVFPFVVYGIQRSHTIQYSLCVVTALYAVAIVFPLYLNLAPAARRQVSSRGS
ncbi:MFS transporter-like protein [Xylogone sp. PMI_703]|nr:MFS transporter-like protein [Xylogone sp. PMI_703]